MYIKSMKATSTCPQTSYTLAYDTTLENTWSNVEEKIERAAREEEEDLKNGYVTVTCEDEPKGVRIRLPEEYILDDEDSSSTEIVRFKTLDESGSRDITITYDMTSLAEHAMRAEAKKDHALISEKTAKKLTQEQGGTMESSGIQTRQVGDLEVTYMMIYEVYPEYHLQKIRYITWTSIDETYLLGCEIDQTRPEGVEMSISKDATILDTLFGDVKW